MRRNSLSFLVGAVVVLAAVAVGVHLKERSAWGTDEDPLAGQPALPELARLEPADLVALELVDRDGTVRVEREGEGWVLPGVDRFPARADRVAELVRGLETLRLGEASTKDPAKHERVGLVAPEDGGEESVLVRVLGPGESVVAELLLGREDFSRASTSVFVRRPDQDQCWLATGRVPRSTSASAWYDGRVLALPTSEVRTAAIEFEGRPDDGYALTRDDPEGFGFELAPIPPGRERGEEWRATGLARAFSGLSAGDVRSAAGFEPEAVERARVRLETYQGLVVELELVRTSDGPADVPGATWARVDASTTADTAGPSPAEADDLEAARARAQELDARLAGWWFELPASTAATLWRPLAELLAPLPEPAADADGGTGPEGEADPEVGADEAPDLEGSAPEDGEPAEAPADPPPPAPASPAGGR